MNSRVLALVALALGLVGCDEAGTAPSVVVLVRGADLEGVTLIAELLPEGVAEVREESDPAAALAAVAAPYAIALVPGELDCEECYVAERLDAADASRVVVRAGEPRAALYGLAHALEAVGVRFFHPFRTHVPGAFEGPSESSDLFAGMHEPELSVRGLQLHTLHPIEPYFALWESGEESLAQARRILAWMAANRSNVVQWPALDDVGDVGSERHAEWLAHTRQVLDAAHALGMRAGINVQLFSGANLQQALDLVDEEAGDLAPQIEETLDVFADLEFEKIGFAFGEFEAADPQVFVDAMDIVTSTVEARWPDIQMSASIHVGGGLDVEWMGETINYYFLVTRSHPQIVPYVHTVMYYDLYEDVGGAYELDTFDGHRELLLDLLEQDRDVVYYPESAYWVAFDNSVPTYLPLYVSSRHLDLARLRQDTEAAGSAPLDGHVVFSSGWEWGYWQNDVASLRMSWELSESPSDQFAWMLSPLGGDTDEAVGAIADLADAQHLALIERRATAWYSGLDAVLEGGEALGIQSQPLRPSFEEVTAMTEAERAALADGPLAALAELADSSEAALERLRGAGLPASDPFVQELLDGFEIDVLRARFAHATLSAALAHAAGDDPTDLLSSVDDLFDEAMVVSDRRHAALHHPDAAKLVAKRVTTATLYDYGYLREAATLCYWTRERAQLRNAVLGEDNRTPGCVL